AVQAQRDGDHRDTADDTDDDQLPYGVLGDAEDVAHPAVDLQGAQSEGDRDTEDRADDGDDVDELADRPMDPLTEKRLDDRAATRRQIPLVDEVGGAQRLQGEDRPGMQGEMVEREVHCIHGGACRFGVYAQGWSPRWIPELADGFGHAPEHQDAAD